MNWSRVRDGFDAALDDLIEASKGRYPDLQGRHCVDPDTDQPGGGVEYWTTRPIDAGDLPWVQIAP